VFALINICQSRENFDTFPHPPICLWLCLSLLMDMPIWERLKCEIVHVELGTCTHAYQLSCLMHYSPSSLDWMKQQPQLLSIFQHTSKDQLVKTSVGHAFHFVTNCWFWFWNISKDQGATSYSFLKKNINLGFVAISNLLTHILSKALNTYSTNRIQIFSHKKSLDSWHICEINFVGSSITMYTMQCLLWHILY
jgi:hypothetical protein